MEWHNWYLAICIRDRILSELLPSLSDILIVTVTVDIVIYIVQTFFFNIQWLTHASNRVPRALAIKKFHISLMNCIRRQSTEYFLSHGIDCEGGRAITITPVVGNLRRLQRLLLWRHRNSQPRPPRRLQRLANNKLSDWPVEPQPLANVSSMASKVWTAGWLWHTLSSHYTQRDEGRIVTRHYVGRKGFSQSGPAKRIRETDRKATARWDVSRWVSNVSEPAKCRICNVKSSPLWRVE